MQLLRKYSVLLAVVLFSVMSFGLLIPFLGFYWDDWPMIWFSYTQGPLGFPEVFSGDRPFLSLIYILTTSILKTSPLQWQLLGLFTRILTAMSFWWAFKQLWPDQREKLAWAALLFAVYPGFKQQPISVVYSNGLFPLAAYFLSIGWMIRSIKQVKHRLALTIGGVLAYIFCMFSTEYYYGMDLVRPLIIFIAIGASVPNLKHRLKQTFLYWLPYLMLLGGFLIWRVFIFEFPTYQPVLLDSLTDQPAVSLGHLIYRILHEPILAGLFAWTSYLRFPTLEDFSIQSMVGFWIVVIGAFALSLLMLIKLLPHDREAPGNIPSGQAKLETGTQSFIKQALSIGGFSLLMAGWPYWITGLRIELQYPYDRFTLAFMMGSALLVAGLITWLFRTHLQKVLVLALLISMAVGENFLNANTYRREWQTQNDFFNQLVWRIPDLEPGTLVLTEGLPLKYYSDNSLTAPLNLIYAPENKSLNLDHYFAFLDVRLGRSIPELKKGLEITQEFRNAIFTGSTDKIIVIFYSPPGCLRVLDPVRDQNLEIMPSELLSAVSISNPDQIITDESRQVVLPQSIFDTQAGQDNWCYYFQRADLARQTGDWQLAVELTDKAYKKRLYPQEPTEVMLVAEANAMNGNIPRAAELLLETGSLYPQYHEQICETVDRFEIALSGKIKDNQKSEIINLRAQLICD